MAIRDVAPSATSEFRSVNPATGEVMGTFDEDSDAAVHNKLDRATAAFRIWRDSSFVERSLFMQRAAEILESEKERLGRLMTLEMGKPLQAAIQEAEKCAWGCRFYAENEEAFLADEPVQTNATCS